MDESDDATYNRISKRHDVQSLTSVMMRRSRHASWLSLNKVNDDWWLFDHGSLTGFYEKIEDPESAYPSVIAFFGHRTKNDALRIVFPRNSHGRLEKTGIASLRIDTDTVESSSPVLFVDVNLAPGLTAEQRPDIHVAEQRFRLEWPTETAEINQVAETVLSRLVLPFCDIICFFAEDFDGPGGFEAVLLRLLSTAVDLEQRRPALLIVGSSEHLDRYLQCATHLADIFSGVKIVEIAGPHVSPAARFLNLRDVVKHECDTARRAQAAEHHLFSAAHLHAFFEQAKLCVARSSTGKFSFLRNAREGNCVSPRFEHHLHDFLALGHKHELPVPKLAKYVAAVILLDSYPPGMHAFDPRSVFRSFYGAPCFSAYVKHRGVTCSDARDWCTRMEQEFTSLYENHQRCGSSSSSLQPLYLGLDKRDVGLLHMNTGCIFCLMRKPEHVLSCRHSICNICAVRFGKPDMPEYHYEISQCPLCSSVSPLLVKLVPPTAGARILAIDGGGVRGEVSLILLQALDEARGLGYPVQDEFDFAMGTSAGGLAVLQLFVKGLGAKDGVSMFDRLALRVFAKKRSRSVPFLSALYEMIRTMVSGSRYDVVNLEKCLKEAFGEEQRLFSAPERGPSGTKIAVTATTKRGRLCVLSNYNGVLPRESGCGYTHFRPSDSDDELRVWETAQVTSAAPSIFPPKLVKGIGLLQDGGVGRHNNPVAAACWESRIALDAKPDMLVSIGTGFSEPPITPGQQDSYLIRNSWIVRLFLAVWSELSAEGRHIDHQNHMDDEARGRYFRMNVPLAQEPALDDVSKMEELRLATHSFVKDSALMLSAIRDAFCAASFFFELHRVPSHDGELYRCSGAIRCRSPDAPALLSSLLRHHPFALFKTSSDIALGKVRDGSCCGRCKRYRKPVMFRVQSLDQRVSVQLCLNRLHERPIGGFPNSMDWFRQRQGLGDAFGRADHLRSSVHFRRLCRCPVGSVAGSKRQSGFDDGEKAGKKTKL